MLSPSRKTAVKQIRKLLTYMLTLALRSPPQTTLHQNQMVAAIFQKKISKECQQKIKKKKTKKRKRKSNLGHKCNAFIYLCWVVQSLFWKIQLHALSSVP